MIDVPVLTQFRTELPGNGLVHLIFDCPGRTMNVFSDAAIDDLGAFSRWLCEADVTGVLIRSGKANAFCAGADLNELGVAYDMIVAAPRQRRFDIAFTHFFRLSTAMRLLETAGKPVAVAIAGLALGGGCELTLAAHYRVLVDDPAVSMGLPESLVGLLPGAGGTQRLPRLIGAKAALPILLDGARLSQQAAVDAGLVHVLAGPGEEIAMAEAWLLSSPVAAQPWDQDGWVPEAASAVSAIVAPARDATLAATLGHYPAPLAILDCVEFGLPQIFDGAIRTEMAIFSQLIQRPEARDMIQTLFLGKTDYDRHVRKNDMPGFVLEAITAVRHVLQPHLAKGELSRAGFRGGPVAPVAPVAPVRSRAREGYWLDGSDKEAEVVREVLKAVGAAIEPLRAGQTPEALRLADYAIVRETGYPAYLGGPFKRALSD